MMLNLWFRLMLNHLLTCLLEDWALSLFFFLPRLPFPQNFGSCRGIAIGSCGCCCCILRRHRSSVEESGHLGEKTEAKRARGEEEENKNNFGLGNLNFKEREMRRRRRTWLWRSKAVKTRNTEEYNMNDREGEWGEEGDRASVAFGKTRSGCSLIETGKEWRLRLALSCPLIGRQIHRGRLPML
jgi:hypothetical protein